MDDKMKIKFEEKYEMKLEIENEADFKHLSAKYLGKESPLDWQERIYYLLLMFLQFIYETVYFYFFPYIAIICAATQ